MQSSLYYSYLEEALPDFTEISKKHRKYELENSIRIETNSLKEDELLNYEETIVKDIISTITPGQKFRIINNDLVIDNRRFQWLIRKFTKDNCIKIAEIINKYRPKLQPKTFEELKDVFLQAYKKSKKFEKLQELLKK